MYQAIVFLPLVGAILAGLIALAGARARYPSGMPAPAGHDHGADHHDHAAHDHGSHDHGAPGHGDHGHDGHHPSEPAAAGSRAAELITTSLLFVSMILSWIAFVSVGFGHDVHVTLVNWFTAGDLKVEARQLVEIARALSYGARFIILDEPTAELDGEEVKRAIEKHMPNLGDHRKKMKAKAKAK